ncbi:MAG: hypothetical protein JWQ49_2071 [Edaphobacter sp.]|nr:hypothetical protein [Edaphobacter sp.]
MQGDELVDATKVLFGLSRRGSMLAFFEPIISEAICRYEN